LKILATAFGFFLAEKIFGDRAVNKAKRERDIGFYRYLYFDLLAFSTIFSIRSFCRLYGFTRDFLLSSFYPEKMQIEILWKFPPKMIFFFSAFILPSIIVLLPRRTGGSFEIVSASCAKLTREKICQIKTNKIRSNERRGKKND
jgi:hypothetical protein